MNIASLMIQNNTNIGQAMQGINLLNKLSPEGKLYMAMKSVENINDKVKAKLGDKAKDIEVAPGLMQAYKEALDGGDAGKVKEAWHDIEQNVADQIPSNWIEKLDSWRYLAMLGNPRTHIRNIAGNVGFMPVRMIKNAVATGLERAFIGKAEENSGRTKATLNPLSADDKMRMQTAWGDYDNVEGLIQSGGKFNDTASEIDNLRTIYGLKPLETVRKANNYALDKEDTWFSRPAYAESLAGYLKANGYSAADFSDGKMSAEAVNKAQQYAIKEAQKATYRDTNDFSQFVSHLGKSIYKDNTAAKIGGTFVEAVLPFKKTPANILARGWEYSPLEFGTVLAKDVNAVKSGTMQPAEMIDHISSGLTGTALLGLGVYLASQGLLSGGSSGDDKQDNFKKLQGQQDYALSIGDKNYTMDWLAPEALPVFVGVELWNNATDKGLQAKDLYNALTRVASPVVEMSMLQGVNDMIDSVSYADSSTKIWSVIASAATSYLSQYIPTLGGQIERTAEGSRQTTFTDKNSAIPSDAQYAIAKAANKIPGVEYEQIPYVDAWGRTQSTGSPLERAINNFTNPSYVSRNNTTNVDREVQRLYSEGYQAGNMSVLPQKIGQSDKVNNKQLTADQYVKYTQTRGQTSYDMISEYMNSDDYKDMTDAERADVIGYIYKYAAAKATKDVDSTYDPNIKWLNKAINNSQNPFEDVLK